MIWCRLGPTAALPRASWHVIGGRHTHSKQCTPCPLRRARACTRYHVTEECMRSVCALSCMQRGVQGGHAAPSRGFSGRPRSYPARARAAPGMQRGVQRDRAALRKAEQVHAGARPAGLTQAAQRGAQQAARALQAVHAPALARARLRRRGAAHPRRPSLVRRRGGCAGGAARGGAAGRVPPAQAAEHAHGPSARRRQPAKRRCG